jgi:hypothetical protein
LNLVKPAALNALVYNSVAVGVDFVAIGADNGLLICQAQRAATGVVADMTTETQVLFLICANLRNLRIGCVTSDSEFRIAAVMR